MPPHVTTRVPGRWSARRRRPRRCRRRARRSGGNGARTTDDRPTRVRGFVVDFERGTNNRRPSSDDKGRRRTVLRTRKGNRVTVRSPHFLESRLHSQVTLSARQTTTKITSERRDMHPSFGLTEAHTLLANHSVPREANLPTRPCRAPHPHDHLDACARRRWQLEIARARTHTHTHTHTHLAQRPQPVQPAVDHDAAARARARAAPPSSGSGERHRAHAPRAQSKQEAVVPQMRWGRSERRSFV